MKARSFKLGLVVAGIVLLASCSKHHGNADVGYGEGGASAHGLGQFTQFAGQEPGESYTTQAPHNQRYLFAYDDASFAPKYKPSLMAQADYLRSHPGARVLLAGHTDERGSREYNVALGERRANTVANLLRMSGVSRQQIRVVSYGKERPLYTGHDEEAHKMNRRVELTYEATR
ncbi:peptidoglycan-associated lipoprotein Pal [Legionella micdadei]|uniref:Peptidoglycan-associated lipoprotein n=1 Tax=Legionella micdadei TaxID=451 RepID=A0A098GJ11_LEGMI|nr:peptidoglycan-associated lipoprotein Pal [Legionella micdadei]ARG96632.1 peptidoglycan-associated lipoprotein [Legionella micdadei]ARG99380.1 peptidoglycan-associated lipoprotein [Legionella micdadei]KTD29376.1 Peptidoglycan-associated lipoprotein precursor (19 kDa surface antigen) (PPL) [Legionella micdadei]NSL18922.1 peptidoglycan-associated lipoprotein Pal [Legionella micdadei]CEG61997.1 Peptidoglycan-associated lipoprotein [Legionella micdadei]